MHEGGEPQSLLLMYVSLLHHPPLKNNCTQSKANKSTAQILKLRDCLRFCLLVPIYILSRPQQGYFLALARSDFALRWGGYEKGVMVPPYARAGGCTLPRGGGLYCEAEPVGSEETPPGRPFSADSLEGTGGSPSLPSENAVPLVSEAGAPSRGHAGHSAGRALSVLGGPLVPGDPRPRGMFEGPGEDDPPSPRRDRPYFVPLQLTLENALVNPTDGFTRPSTFQVCLPVPFLLLFPSPVPAFAKPHCSVND